jgi:hypothetical protein
MVVKPKAIHVLDKYRMSGECGSYSLATFHVGTTIALLGMVI